VVVLGEGEAELPSNSLHIPPKHSKTEIEGISGEKKMELGKRLETPRSWATRWQYLVY